MTQPFDSAEEECCIHSGKPPIVSVPIVLGPEMSANKDDHSPQPRPYTSHKLNYSQLVCAAA